MPLLLLLHTIDSTVGASSARQRVAADPARGHQRQGQGEEAPGQGAWHVQTGAQE